MSDVSLGLQRLARQVNGKARYGANVPVRFLRDDGTYSHRVIVNRADYRRKNDPKGTSPRVYLWVGPTMVAVLYDAEGWEVA